MNSGIYGKSVAAEFGVSKQTLSFIRSRVTWRGPLD